MEEEKKQDEQELWTNIESLLAEAVATHFAESRYHGKTVRVAWKELTLDEVRARPIDPEILSKMEEKEKVLTMDKWVEDDVLARIAKAGKTSGCLNDNVIDSDTWRKLPLKVRNDLTLIIEQTQEALEKAFR